MYYKIRKMNIKFITLYMYPGTLIASYELIVHNENVHNINNNKKTSKTVRLG